MPSKRGPENRTNPRMNNLITSHLSVFLIFLILIPSFFFQGSLQVRYRLSKDESHVFNMDTENLANRRVHQVKISRDVPELSIQVFHFSNIIELQEATYQSTEKTQSLAQPFACSSFPIDILIT